MQPISTRIAGVSFSDDYPDNLKLLTESHFFLEASLIREPDNEHDPNAIAVLCGGSLIGRLPRSLAEKLAPKLDAGEKWRVIKAEILIHPEHEDRPGVEIKLEKVETNGNR